MVVIFSFKLGCYQSAVPHGSRTGGGDFLSHAKAVIDVLEDLKAGELVMEEAFPISSYVECMRHANPVTFSHDLLNEAKQILKNAEEDEEKITKEISARVKADSEKKDEDQEMTEEAKEAIQKAMSVETEKKGGLVCVINDRPRSSDPSLANSDTCSHLLPLGSISVSAAALNARHQRQISSGSTLLVGEISTDVAGERSAEHE